MKPSNTPSDSYPNLQWERVPGSEDYFDQVDALAVNFWKVAVVFVLTAALLPVAGFWVVSRSRQPNPVQVVADGRVFSGELTQGVKVSDAVLLQQMADTIEVLLTRNEKGGVPGLKEYLSPGVMELVDQLYAPSLKMKDGYTQTFAISSYRVLVNQPNWVVLGVRGLLSSRTLNGYQFSEIYFIAGFTPGEKTPRNALGWRLFRFAPDPDGQLYYNEELAKQRAARLGAQ